MKHYLTGRNNDFFGNSLFDGFFDDFFAPTMYHKGFSEMKTDIKETDNGYSLSVDMPGFEKNDINLSLKDGYLTVSANREEKDTEDSYVKRERSMTCSRSYYVGKEITEDDVKAKYQNGTLKIEVPKKQNKEIESKNIRID